MSYTSIQTQMVLKVFDKEQRGNAKTYAEHPDIKIPDILQGNGWEDVSNHMDEHPCSQLSLPDGSGVKVWIGYCELSHPLGRIRKPPIVVEFYVSLTHQDDPEVLYEGTSINDAMMIINQRRINLLTEILLGSIKE